MNEQAPSQQMVGKNDWSRNKRHISLKNNLKSLSWIFPMIDQNDKLPVDMSREKEIMSKQKKSKCKRRQ